MGLIIITGLLATFQIVSPYSLTMDFAEFLTKFQIWRLFTCFAFVGGVSMNLLMMLLLIHFGIGSLEKEFGNNIYDFYYLVCFTMISHLVSGLLLGIYPMMAEQFCYTFLYIYCKRQPDNTMSFFGFQIQSKNFPWVIMVVHILFGVDYLKFIAGYGSGHLYEFLTTTLPQEKGIKILDTPRWFKGAVSWVSENIFSNNKPPQQFQSNNMRNLRDLRSDNQNQQANNASSSGFAAFRGKGVRLGGE
ncbi:unnamed protein product [Moneuplotes crassus]|uniref:Derlin n=1 Tax=Euplotes crassus TaxID=5936 RepID=A0AAD1XV98_EUPCR|nr:unnamed protein product [Moneuplotes crassus]